MRLALTFRPASRLLALSAAAAVVGLAAGAGLGQVPQVTPATDLQKKLDLLAQTMIIVRDRHFLKPDVANLLDGAIRGMLEKVDPDAHYFNKGEYDRLKSQPVSPATLAGVGLEIRKEPGQRRGLPGGLRVVGAIDGSSAAQAGLKPHDVITHIDGEPAAGWPVGTAEARLVGPAGSRLTLSVLRRGADDTFDVTLERRTASIAPDVRALAGGVVLVRLAGIDAAAVATVEAAVADLRAKAGQAFAGVVLDLRNSPGGTLKSAVALADAFLDSGTIAAEKSRRTDKPVPVAVARPGDAAAGKPIAVLINGGTAMAGEIVAVALRDNKRATVIGTRSFGMTGERQLIPLGKPQGDSGAVLLTTKRYVGPAGGDIDGKGVIPDIAVEQAVLDAACRDIDVRTPEGPCRNRADAADTQLEWALVLVQGRLTSIALP